MNTVTNELAPVDSWQALLEGDKAGLEGLLPGYLQTVRWFGGKARTVTGVLVLNSIPLGDSSGAQVAIIQVNYADAEPQAYVLPLNFASGQRAADLERDASSAIIARLQAGGERGVLYDATWDAEFASALLDAIRDERSFTHPEGGINAWPTQAFGQVLGDGSVQPRILRGEQSNTSIAYGNRAILKLFRRMEEGTSPDLEVSRFLGEQGFENTPPLAGALEYLTDSREPLTLAILQGFVANKGDAWEYTLGAVAQYFDRAQLAQGTPELPKGQHLLETAQEEVPQGISEVLGDYLESARLLGRRTAEMHLALASDPNNPAFAPEPFDAEYLHALYGSVKGLTDQAFHLLHNRFDPLPQATRQTAEEVTAKRSDILAGFQPLLEGKLQATRTRCHGDYHLGQVLYTGSDFFIIDFEGEPVRPLRERRMKHSPLKDVGGMLRSFHYAAYAALFDRQSKSGSQGLETWADAWHRWVSAAYLGEYLNVASAGSFLPTNPADLRTLLDIYLLEKAVYELIYELNNRPGWVQIPLQGVRELVP